MPLSRLLSPPALARLRPRLSMLLALMAQHAYGACARRPWARRVLAGFLAPRQPRFRHEGERCQLVRPLYAPQTGRRVLELRGWPHGESALVRLAFRARTRRRVLIPTRMLTSESADAIATLAAVGAPLEVEELPPELGLKLGPELGAAITAPPSHGATPRELRSVRLRRAGLPRYWGERAAVDASASSVSVLLSSVRPHSLPAAVQQVARQSHCNVQLLVGLHGPGWSHNTEAEIRDHWSGELIVVRRPEDVNLGEVLNALTARADGLLVSKWDDDDWYGVHHLHDLLLAYNYSGADIVGKAAEFVYLEESDCTVRRFALGAESYRWTIAGGALLMSRDWLDHVGGWPCVPRAVDQALLHRSREAGGKAYRTHGFQFLVRRRAPSANAHTWGADDQYFLRTASEVRPGLDFAFADIAPGRDLSGVR